MNLFFCFFGKMKIITYRDVKDNISSKRITPKSIFNYLFYIFFSTIFIVQQTVKNIKKSLTTFYVYHQYRKFHFRYEYKKQKIIEQFYRVIIIEH